MSTTGSKSSETFNVYRKGITSDEVFALYNKWNSYDQDLDAVNYIGPSRAAQAVDTYLHGKCDQRILDVGAGSGKIAQELLKYGFKNIDALEPAREFLENSEYRNLYTKCIYKYLGSKAVSDIQDDEYDVIVSSGAFGEGHIPCSGLQDIVRVVKPGGLVFILMREEYLQVKEYKDRLEPYMQELVDHGCWQRKERTTLPNFCGSKQGVMYVFQVQCKGFKDFSSKCLAV